MITTEELIFHIFQRGRAQPPTRWSLGSFLIPKNMWNLQIFLWIRSACRFLDWTQVPWCSYWCVLRREFLGLIPVITSNVIIPATPSNPSSNPTSNAPVSVALLFFPMPPLLMVASLHPLTSPFLVRLLIFWWNFGISPGQCFKICIVHGEHLIFRDHVPFYPLNTLKKWCESTKIMG